MKVVVIGGGAAGMLAAIFSARHGSSVAIIEKKIISLAKSSL